MVFLTLSSFCVVPYNLNKKNPYFWHKKTIFSMIVISCIKKSSEVSSAAR
jgi:hypothetical protein